MTWDCRRVPDRRRRGRGLVMIIRGAEHFSIFAPELVADLICEWISPRKEKGYEAGPAV